ncbi:MAG: response regulator transcription factor [Crocinitomicaceae bacterium]|nr:response regulator transcription factor [Crocinitomicaceae bacterium]
MIKLAIVDDDVLVVELLANFLSLNKEFEITFTANSGEECLEKINAADTDVPDVLLLDLRMGKVTGLNVLEELGGTEPDIRIIVISSHYKDSFMGFMLKTGVSAFLPKGISPKKLEEVIFEVFQRGFYFLPDQLNMVRSQVSSKAPKPELVEENLLSEREIEILKLICNQKTAKEIGESLFIAQRTVEGHKNNLFVKTGARNIAGLVIYAAQKEIILIEELPLFLS